MWVFMPPRILFDNCRVNMTEKEFEINKNQILQ